MFYLKRNRLNLYLFFTSKNLLLLFDSNVNVCYISKSVFGLALLHFKTEEEVRWMRGRGGRVVHGIAVQPHERLRGEPGRRRERGDGVRRRRRRTCARRVGGRHREGVACAVREGRHGGRSRAGSGRDAAGV